jgi:hypothetical protein
MFVTSDGHPHARFRRALLTRNLGIILPAAAELGRIGLDDALKILVVLAEKRDPRFEPAAARFAGRVIVEQRLGLADARLVLALAEALPRSPEAIGHVLQSYCARR